MKRLIGILCLWGVAHLAYAAQLHQILATRENKGWVLDFMVRGNDRHRILVLHHPERIVIDFQNTQTTQNIQRSLSHVSLVQTIRIGYPKPGQMRLVLEMRQPVSIHTGINLHRTAYSQGWQLSLQPQQKSPTRPIKPSNMVPKRRFNRDVTVVLDPGHGGKDPGAMGMRHTQEKQIVLAMARRLKTLIDKQPGMRAVLTRNGDYYIGLRERMRIARRHHADLFVAIHADAFGNRLSHGASVFALSQRGATSEAARWLAEKENYSELGGVNLAGLEDNSGIIRSVLIDLAQTATIGESLQLGQRILSSLNHLTSLHHHKVEQARFMVLKSPDVPSLLIETGFISNPHEEANLNNPAYQTQLCEAIARGIRQYFWEYPPHGSRIETMIAQQHHTVSPRINARRGRG